LGKTVAQYALENDFHGVDFDRNRNMVEKGNRV
jgi:hypothetical protein